MKIFSVFVLLLALFGVQGCNKTNPSDSRTPESPSGVMPNPNTKSEAKAAPTEETIYTCPMHPEIESKTPGNCPKCGMKLVPKGG